MFFKVLKLHGLQKCYAVTYIVKDVFLKYKNMYEAYCQSNRKYKILCGKRL